MTARFPEKLEPLFRPARYKVLYSGRGAGKSWGVARALLIRGANEPLRVLCAREVQGSLRESVHRLLCDQIELLGLADRYNVEQRSITGRNGTEFIFVGLSDQTANSLKSFEAVDICWVEEAQNVSDNSWNILTKTIRPTRPDKAPPEIWITFNPELDTDPTWVRFVENPYPDSVVIAMTYRDNPWHSQVMEQERQRDLALLPESEYQNLWEGKCRPAVSGAIYAAQVAQMFAERRVCDVPLDATRPAYAVFDLGWNDQMSIIICQRVLSALRIIDYMEVSHKTLDWCSKALRGLDYDIQRLYLPHDGAHGDYRTGQSAQDILHRLGWRATVLPVSPVEDGIRAVRMTFRQIYIDKRCERLIECLKRYRRAIPKSTGEAAKPLHDEFSHGADALRYAVLAAPQMDSVNNGEGLKLPPLEKLHPAWAERMRKAAV